MAAPSAGVDQAQAAAAKSLLGQGDQFARTLANLTGLNVNVLRAWVLAEGGPPGNPLNIMHGGKPANFGDVNGAAAATSQLLHSSAAYAPILRSASSDPQAQIAAITASPWDAGHYRGDPSAKPGTLLHGTYARVLDALGIGGPVQSGITGAVGDFWSGVTGIPGAIEAGVKSTQSWVEKEAVIGLGYVTLTLLALGLILIGVLRAAGPTIAGARSAGAAASPTRNMEIPF